MNELMSYEEMARLLELDPRNKERDTLYLHAFSERIGEFLNRNILLDETTGREETNYREFFPKEYPVREFIELINAHTGEPLTLAKDTPVLDISRPDAHRNRAYRIEGNPEKDITVHYRIRYGYTQEEMPALIKACILDLMRDRLDYLSNPDSPSPDLEDRLKDITVYKRLYL